MMILNVFSHVKILSIHSKLYFWKFLAILENKFYNFINCDLFFFWTVIQYWWCGVLWAPSCGPCPRPGPASGNSHCGWSGWTQSSWETDMWSSQQERQVEALFYLSKFNLLFLFHYSIRSIFRYLYGVPMKSKIESQGMLTISQAKLKDNLFHA